MPPSYQTDLYRRLREQIDAVRMIDTHEHLQRESELPGPDEVGIGRFFAHYANCDLVSAGMRPADMARLIDRTNGLSAGERWKLMKPWYPKARNTTYFEAIRIALRELYGIEDFTDRTVGPLTERMREQVRPGFTRMVFDRAGIDYAMNNPFGPKQIFNADFGYDCFIVDMRDSFTDFPILELQAENDISITCLDDYLELIDSYFERDAKYAGAFKIGRAYTRPLTFEDVPRGDVEGTFNRLLAFCDRPDQRDIQALEDYIVHYLCRKCGEYGIRMKFHTGFQEGNGNVITNSRAARMANLFLKYPRTGFHLYHISYPYQDEAVTLTKNFQNVTIDFCWAWVFNPPASRGTLSELLDAVPANKIHGFGGDYIFVEGSYGHSVIARREITRVLAEKVEEGRFSEDEAVRLGRMLLRDNAIENFGLKKRRAAFKRLCGKGKGKPKRGK